MDEESLIGNFISRHLGSGYMVCLSDEAKEKAKEMTEGQLNCCASILADSIRKSEEKIRNP